MRNSAVAIASCLAAVLQVSLPALTSALTAAASQPSQQQSPTRPAFLNGSRNSSPGATRGSGTSVPLPYSASNNGSAHSSNGSGQPVEQRPDAASYDMHDMAGSSGSRHRQGIERYRALLSLLDKVAAHAIEEALQDLEGVLTEPHVARIISQHLPPGRSLHTLKIDRSHYTQHWKGTACTLNTGRSRSKQHQKVPRIPSTLEGTCNLNTGRSLLGSQMDAHHRWSAVRNSLFQCSALAIELHWSIP